MDLLSAGQIEKGYQQLKENGCIKQMPIDSLRLEAVVKDYLQRDEKQQAQTLILAGTNQEKESITTQVRQGLINQEKLGQESRDISILKSKDLNKFSLTQASNYDICDVVKFRQNSTKFNKELYYRVDAIDTRAGTLTLRDSYDTTQILELNRYQDREVFQSQSRKLRPGEQRKFTRNHYLNQQSNENSNY